MTHSTHEFALTLPITQTIHQTASTFARQQPTPAKAEHVRLNTLSVLVVQNYLQLMEIPTDLTVSDSWDAVMRVCLDVADLEVPGVGRLECRPVQPNRDRCLVPAETWEDRVGYVVVQIDESASEAQILGFVPSVSEEEVLLNQLRSPEDLLDHLDQLRQVRTAVSEATPARVERVLTDLGNWLQSTLQEGQQAIAQGWQMVDQVLNQSALSPAYAFRRAGTSVRRAKRVQLGGVTVALIVEVQVETDYQTDIRLQLHPVDDQMNLPTGLQMAVLDVDDQVVIDAQATGAEDFLELQIDGASGEEFSVQLRLNSFEDTQAFVI